MLLEESPVDVLHLGSSGGLAEGEHEDIGNVVTGVVVVGGLPVGLGLGDIGEDGGPVGEEVLGESLDELGGVGEDLGPVLNLGDVVSHALAVSEVLGELGDDVSNLLDSLEDVLEVSLGKVGDGVGDLLLKGLGVLEASLDLGKVVLANHSEDESGNELLDTSGVHVVLGGNDACDSGSNSHI